MQFARAKCNAEPLDVLARKLAELSPDEQRRYRLDLAAFGTAAISIDGQGKPTYRPLIEIQIERKARRTASSLHCTNNWNVP